MNGHPAGEGAFQPRGHHRVEQHEHAAVGLASDQAAKGLPQLGPGEHVVQRAAAKGIAPCPVQDIGPGPGHALEGEQAQAVARNVDPVADGIGAEQAGVGLVPEDVDQCAGVHGVDVLGEQRQAALLQWRADAVVDPTQAADCGE